jgi:L-aminopeptidase/D-esterase-like protein
MRRLVESGREAGRRPPGGGSPLNTTLVVVATDVTLTKAQARKLAGVAHDGLARAVRPAHLMVDGDTVFALATGERPLPSPVAGVEAASGFDELLGAGADVVTRAVVSAVLAAETVDTPDAVIPAYRDLYGDTGE